MMHKWESQDKLLSEWEAQKVANGFNYEEFSY